MFMLTKKYDIMMTRQKKPFCQWDNTQVREDYQEVYDGKNN